MLVLSCESIFYYQLKQSTFWLVGPVYDLTKISHITVFNFSINCHYVPYIYFNYSIINYCLSWPAFNIRLDIVNGFASLNIDFNYNTPWKLYIYICIFTHHVFERYKCVKYHLKIQQIKFQVIPDTKVTVKSKVHLWADTLNVRTISYS